MVEPIQVLSERIFDTVNTKADIVISKQDLELSKRSLDGMLEEFAANTNSRTWKFLYGSDSVVPSECLERDQAEVLDVMMRTYESDLRNPIRGIMLGGLISAMLIQMQKLKISGEAAMLTMDRVLASNNLTMAITAAFPAFGLAGLTIYLGREWFLRATNSPKLLQTVLIEALRLRMVEVERSLQSVYGAKQTVFLHPDGTSGGGSAGIPGPISPRRTRSRVLSGFSGFSFDPVTATSPPSMEATASGVVPGTTTAPVQLAPIHVPPHPRRLSILRTNNSLNDPQNSLTANDLLDFDDYDEDSAAIESYEATLGAKGLLAYRMHRFRCALEGYYGSPGGFWRWLIGRNLSMSSILGLSDINTQDSHRRHQTLSYIRADGEFDAIEKDFRDLASPDYEVAGQRKIETAVRMRSSYRCLALGSLLDNRGQA